MSNRWEWVEILEPRTKECIYANLSTGECVWEPPIGVSIKRTDGSHWWQLFDERTSRFYYYNAVTEETAWHRPTNGDIIPLAKLQTLKQNTRVPDQGAKNRTRPAEKREISTQTPLVSSVPQLCPRSQKLPGSRFTRSQSTSEDHVPRSRPSFHMAQSSRCQGYQHTRPPNTIQPFADGTDSSQSFSVSPSKRFSPQHHMPSRDYENHSIKVVSNGHCTGENPQADRPLQSPANLRQHSRIPSGEDVHGCITYDNPADFFGDLSGSLYEDLLQMVSFPAPTQPKARPFPRTNPSYVAPNHRNVGCGGSSPERQHVSNVPLTATATVNTSKLSQSYFGDAFDRKRIVPHERFDSKISFSSFGIGCLQDGHALPSSSLVGRKNPLGDDLPSPGTLCGGRNDAVCSVLGSKSSTRYISERYGCSKVSPKNSLSTSHCLPHQTTSINSDGHRQRRQTDEGLPSTPTRTRRNSEPDYANLPTVAAETGARHQAGNGLSSSDKLRAMSRDEGNGTGFSSPNGSSPAEFSRKESDTRFGRSLVTQNSEGFVDQESETSSVFSSPFLEPWQSMDSAFEGQHQPSGFEASMRAIGKSKSLDADDRLVPPLSLFSFSHSDEEWNNDPSKSNGTNQMGIEQFALENFNEHRHGILGKTVSIGNMLTWTKDVISKPMIRTQDKAVKKEAPEVFRLIQMYMSDRKAKSPPMQVALEVVQKGWTSIELRDEIYMQLCRQTTENPKEESLIRGWELMGICLSVFPPSSRFHSYLERYFCHHLNLDDSKTLFVHFASHCQRHLDRTSKRGAKGRAFKLTIDYVEQTLKSIFHPSNFGGTLDDIMQIQRDRFPDRQLPWIQTTLSEEVLRLNGAQTEGIFRVSGDTDEVNTLRTYSDQWNVPSSGTDLHSLASLLKQWYRELYEPLIPTEFYNDCIASCSDPDAAVAAVERLPPINRLVFCYLIRFLQVFAASENSSVSKMDASNLATVIAPNCLRCESEDPNVILKNTHKEASFIKTLILNLDTSFMDGIW